ncbi:UNC-50 [Endogone sp. FLAS-F59071]|nr:UNC-50 [Endogone sp. FLAS-F59071]|eukprot:RUS22351.1 UNC-50 [Endogone sp. FLAS-F59071]
MVYLLISPRRVYRNIYYHKQTKNQWARDDPAFLVILSFLLCLSAIAWGIAYGHGFLGILRMMFFMVFIDFVLVGAAVASFCWFTSNRFLTHTSSIHSTDQSVEWPYAFDVHCNAFFPLFLVLYVIQFFFMPLLISRSWIALFVGNSMYLFAACYYSYITFLGYNALPFLLHTELFLVPIAILSVLYIASLFGFNVSIQVLQLYFGS